MVVIDESVRGPKPQPQFFPRDHLSWVIEQVKENLHGLPLQARTVLPVLAQFSGGGVEFKQAEAENATLVRGFGQSFRLPEDSKSILDDRCQ